jgi:hypothetical protein
LRFRALTSTRESFKAFSCQLGFLARTQFQAIFEAAVHCPPRPLRIWPFQVLASLSLAIQHGSEETNLFGCASIATVFLATYVISTRMVWHPQL